MAEMLKAYFPTIREKEELLREIHGNIILLDMYEQLGPELKEEFINFCTGVKGLKILRDSFFKEVINPEYAPERLESLLSVMLGRKVKIVRILPNDSTRISDETSLIVTDIIVELEDGSLANVEVQKIGYKFPGARSACYTSDMLLRQYRRVRSRQGKDFAAKNYVYSQIKNVYLIVIYEKSPKEFKEFPNTYYHHARQVFDSGLKLDLLQEYIMIPLDIYHKRTDNKPIESKLEAWLTFLTDDRPEKIMELITKYPEFKPMYETLYQMCVDVEKVMNMFFSEELRILDRNTVYYMIDEQQKELDEKKQEIAENLKELAHRKEEIALQNERLEKNRRELVEQQERIEEQQGQIAEQQGQIEEQQGQIAEQQGQIAEQQGQIAEQQGQIAEQQGQIAEQQNQIAEEKSRNVRKDEIIRLKEQENMELSRELERLKEELEQLRMK